MFGWLNTYSMFSGLQHDMNRNILLIVFTKQTFLHFNSTYDLLSLYAQSHFTRSESYVSAFFMIIPSCIIFRQSVAITIRAAVHYHRNPRFFFYLTDCYLGTHWLSSSAAKTSWMEWWTTHCIKANHNLKDLSTITAGGEKCANLCHNSELANPPWLFIPSSGEM